jgi:uncharacterized protein
MDRFLDFVLRQLIEFPDELVILKDESPGRVIFRLQMRQTDIRRVVGKHGTTISSIRNLLAAAASKHGTKVNVEIVDENARA